MTGNTSCTRKQQSRKGIALGLLALLCCAPIRLPAQAAPTSPAPTANNGTLAVKTGLQGPVGIAVDAQGNVYITEGPNNNATIRKIDVDTGMMTIIAGGGRFFGMGHPATGVKLFAPSAITFDSAGNLLVANGEFVFKIDARTGMLRKVLGGGQAKPRDDQSLAAADVTIDANGVALDKTGHPYVVDRHGFVLKYEEKTDDVSVVAGDGKDGYAGDGGPATDAVLRWPNGIAIDGQGNIYLADQGNNLVRRIDAATGVITTVAGCQRPLPGVTDLRMLPDGVAAKATEVFICDPTGITFDAQGNLLICGLSTNRVCRVDLKTGILTAIAGAQWQSYRDQPQYAGDGGPAVQAHLNAPEAVACDARGNIYITDFGNCCVRKIDAKTGIITTIAGTGKPAEGK